MVKALQEWGKEISSTLILLTGGEERLGGHERGHHRRAQTDVDGVPGRRQEEEERSSQRRLIPDGTMKIFGGKFKNWRQKLKKILHF